MSSRSMLAIERWLWLLTRTILGLLILAVGARILSPYVNYFPPDFNSGFLTGRADYFWGLYSIGFYAHIVSAPPVLLSGLFQHNRIVLRRWPKAHRLAGKVYAISILLLMAPGGLIMAFAAYGGPVSVTGFLVLSLLTWWFTYQGLQAVWNRRMRDHQRWMDRSFILVCSAIMLRLMSAKAGDMGLSPPHAYAAIAWISWSAPLLLYELATRLRSIN